MSEKPARRPTLRHAQGPGARAPNSNYYRMAELMSRHSYVAIFRRFRTLQARVLLHRQAELIKLEQAFRLGILPSDETGGQVRDLGLGDVADLSSDGRLGQDAYNKKNGRKDDGRVDVALRGQDAAVELLEVKLRKYQKSLLNFQSSESLPEAKKVDLAALRAWLTHRRGGNRFLQGHEALTYLDDAIKGDLACISDAKTGRDAFSALVSDRVTEGLHTWFGSVFGPNEDDDPESAKRGYFRLEATLRVWDSKLLKSITVAFVAFVTLGVPIASLFGLYHIPTRMVEARLGALVGFSSFFGIVLAVFTRAKLVEIFAAVAAFASVQVVFVSGAGASGAPGAS